MIHAVGSFPCFFSVSLHGKGVSRELSDLWIAPAQLLPQKTSLSTSCNSVPIPTLIQSLSRKKMPDCAQQHINGLQRVLLFFVFLSSPMTVQALVTEESSTREEKERKQEADHRQLEETRRRRRQDLGRRVESGFHEWEVSQSGRISKLYLQPVEDPITFERHSQEKDPSTFERSRNAV